MNERLRASLAQLNDDFRAAIDQLPEASAGNEAVTGTLVRDFLQRVMPQGSLHQHGILLDGDGREAGPVSVVVERPNALSLPDAATGHRLHMVEYLATALLATPDLQKERFHDVLRSILSLRSLEVRGSSPSLHPQRVPIYLVVFDGPADANAAARQFQPNEILSNVPDGVWVVKQQYFLCFQKDQYSPTCQVYEAEEAILYFLSRLDAHLREALERSPGLMDYLERELA